MTSESDREAAYHAWINTPLPAHPSNLAFYAGWDAALGAARPRVVETVEELETLPLESVVRTPSHVVNERMVDGWAMTDHHRTWKSDEIELPAQVLFVGGDGE